MTSPEHALHRGRTPSLESMDDDMSHITFETAPFHVPDSTLSHAELKSWHTSLHNESGGRALAGDLRRVKVKGGPHVGRRRQAALRHGGRLGRFIAEAHDAVPTLRELHAIAHGDAATMRLRGLRSYNCPGIKQRRHAGDAGASDALVRRGLAAQGAISRVQGDGFPK